MTENKELKACAAAYDKWSETYDWNNAAGDSQNDVAEDAFRAAYNLRHNEAPTGETWADKEDDLTPLITEAHPTKTGNHDQYAKALELVNNRHSKYALVDLVNYLLGKEDEIKRLREGLEKINLQAVCVAISSDEDRVEMLQRIFNWSEQLLNNEGV